MPNKLFEKVKLLSVAKHIRDKGKTKDSSGTSDAAPNDASLSTTTPPHLQSEKELEARRKERMELRDSRRKERDERLERLEKRREKLDGKVKDDRKLFGLIPPPSSPKKKEPKISKEERDKRDSQLGCCHHFTRFLVKLIHIIDAIIGLSCLIYGLFILFGFTQPAMAAVITCLTFGSFMLFTSIMGAVGFFTSICRRWGIALSAWSAPFIAFFYIFVIVALLGDPNTYFNYLTANQSVLYLNDARIANIRRWLPALYIACACLAVVETCRFFVLRKLRNTLLRYDAANRHIAERSKEQQDSNRTNLTQPLLEDDSRYSETPSWVV